MEPPRFHLIGNALALALRPTGIFRPADSSRTKYALAWLPMAEGTTDGYAQALRREILRSELQRMRALAVILAVLLAITVTGAIVLTISPTGCSRGGIDPMLPLLADRPVSLSTRCWRCGWCACASPKKGLPALRPASPMR